ncbi:MAG: sensor histidine kinase [Fimbriimonadaceae bacterium]
MTGRPIVFWATCACALLASGSAIAVAAGRAPLALAYLAAVAGVGAVVGAVSLDAQREEAEAAAAVHAEAEARASLEAESQRSALDALADGLETVIFLVSDAGEVEFANLAASARFRVEEPEGRKLLSITLSQQLEELIQGITASGLATRQEVNFTHPSDWIGSVQVWPLESRRRIFVAITDVSQIHRLEAVRRDFVANVSHEVRTPLSMVRLSAESLLDAKPTNPEAGRHLTRIISEVDRLTRITDDLLVLSGAETRAADHEPVDLSDLVERACARLIDVAEKKSLLVTLDVQPSISLLGDAVQLSQVATNLVANAISYTQKGEVKVEVLTEADDAVLRVTDTGIGIASEHVTRIFERFYRVDKARSRETGGTGLGLSIVRNIVEAHGGTVTVASELNRGSTFTVRLPLRKPTVESD